MMAGLLSKAKGNDGYRTSQGRKLEAEAKDDEIEAEPLLHWWSIGTAWWVSMQFVRQPGNYWRLKVYVGGKRRVSLGWHR